MDCKIGAAGEKSGHAGQRTAVPSGGMADGRTGGQAASVRQRDGTDRRGRRQARAAGTFARIVSVRALMIEFLT